jgi:nitroreductase
MVEAFRERRAVESARAAMVAETAARDAAALERSERRRRAITWALGALFVAAQTLQIATNLGRP